MHWHNGVFNPLKSFTDLFIINCLPKPASDHVHGAYKHPHSYPCKSSKTAFLLHTDNAVNLSFLLWLSETLQMYICSTYQFLQDVTGIVQKSQANSEPSMKHNVFTCWLHSDFPILIPSPSRLWENHTKDKLYLITVRNVSHHIFTSVIYKGKHLPVSCWCNHDFWRHTWDSHGLHI